MNGDGAPTNLVALIDALIEPPAPDPVSLAPQAPGWWVLGAVLLAALAYRLWRFSHRWRAAAYRRAALRQLDLAADDPAAIAAILRRAALAAYPRREVAGLTGADWVAFLRATGGFPETAALALVRAPYERGGRSNGLRKAAEQWIRTHERAP